MKTLLSILLLFISSQVFCQNILSSEKSLLKSFHKITDWSSNNYGDHNYDSLAKFNDNFEKQLLLFLTKNPASLNLKFNQLKNIGLQTTTSEDGFFKTYSWDDQTGGTMRRFRTIYQFKETETAPVFVKESKEESANLKIDMIPIGNRKYYLSTQLFIASSALFYFKVKFFSIEGNKLNDRVQLILTKTGLKNKLGYEVDYSSQVNKNSEEKLEYFYPHFDHNKKEITIPLLREDGKFTNKKITYKLVGSYFKKQIGNSAN